MRTWLSRIYLLIILFCTAFLIMQAYRHSPWHKQALLRELLTSDSDRKLVAASSLAQLGAQTQLLAALRSEDSTTRELARRGLEFVWHNAAGQEASSLLRRARFASDDQAHREALQLLDRLVEQFPQFAEGWNLRGTLHWELGDYAQSLADCERALALNPHHYLAWQGIGLCKLKQGDVAGACRCLRAALRIVPHDEGMQSSLRQCEELLRSQSGGRDTNLPHSVLL